MIQAMTFLYKKCLKWICDAKSINENMEAVWQSVNDMKLGIVGMVESDNDGENSIDCYSTQRCKMADFRPVVVQ